VDLDLKTDEGKDKDVKLALTLWYENGEAGASKPLTAEVSFKYKVKDAQDTTARLALQLFLAMQDGLVGWSNPRLATKTSLALPKPCQ
jgi:hypothetical protein